MSTFANAAPGHVRDAVRALSTSSGSSSIHARLVSFLCSLSPLPTIHFPFTPTIPFLDMLLVADTPVRSLRTPIARRFLDHRAGVSSALDWSRRAISRYGMPPSDIWTRVWRGPSIPAQRETWYKTLMNSLAIGVRIEYFAEPHEAMCPACPEVLQTHRHFYQACPLANQVWQDFAYVFRLSSLPSLSRILYSWPSSSSSHLGRAYGYRLQAGHAVALHVLWVATVRARSSGVRPSPASVSAQFRFHLRRHFETLARSRRWHVYFANLPSYLRL